MLLNFLVGNNLRLNICCIQKSDSFQNHSEKYTKLISKYAKIQEYNLFNKKIASAQNLNANEAKKSYTEAFLPYKQGFCIALDERGKELTSEEFSKLIADRNELSFFIGGAYGMEREFTQNLDFCLSLSRLTLAHQFVKILLLEQIYRAFCINHHHPYHK